MRTSKKIVWTLVLALGLFVLGVTTSFVLPVAPAYSGALAALLTAASLMLGTAAQVAGAAAFCAGCALFTHALGDGLWPLALWLFALMAGAPLLVRRALRDKTPLIHVMLSAGVGVFAFGAVSFIACNLIAGDAVALATGWLEGMLGEMERASTQLYDMMLSTWSAMGLLPNVGLESAVLQLDGQTRRVLTASLVETFDLSLRVNLMNILAQHAAQIAFLAPLLPLLILNRRGRGAECTPLPDLGLVRIPTKVNMGMMLGVIALWVAVLVSSSAYAVYLAGWSAIQFVYGVQGLSVCEWFFKRRGWSRPARMLVMAAGYLFLPTVLFFVGFMEQICYFRKIGRPTPKDFGMRGPDDEE